MVRLLLRVLEGLTIVATIMYKLVYLESSATTNLFGHHSRLQIGPFAVLSIVTLSSPT